ncbi:MAG: GDSL-type esterase/lipase family protein [Porphyromonas sp.]|nr:GDSL-type esterase/lipase family protein [Porphyromonas sp.]
MKRQILVLLTLLLGAPSLHAQQELPPFKPFAHYIMRESMFEEAPTHHEAIIFLGNSITDRWQWGEYFHPSDNKAILNRGIGGDVTAGMLHRLPEIVRHQPSKLFLMIGINDLLGSKPNEEILANIEQILTTLKRQSPQTQIYVQSILPINKVMMQVDTPSVSTDNIRAMNTELQLLAGELGCEYIDLFSLMLDPETDMLYEHYTMDGIHLTATGYRQWVNKITPLVIN